MWRFSILCGLLVVLASTAMLDKLDDSSRLLLDDDDETRHTPLEMTFDEFMRVENQQGLRRARQVLAPVAAAPIGVGMAPMMAPMGGVPMASGGMTAAEIASLPAILNQLKVMTESVLRTQQQQYQANAFANTWSNSWTAPMGGGGPMGGMGGPGGYMQQPYPQQPLGAYPGPRPEPAPMYGYNPTARTSMNLNFNLNYNSGCGHGGGKYPTGIPMSGYAVGAGGHSFGQGGYAQPHSCPEPEPEPEPEPAAVPVIAPPVIPTNSYQRNAMPMPPMLPQPPMGQIFAADVKQGATPFVPHLENTTEVPTTTQPDIIEAETTETATPSVD